MALTGLFLFMGFVGWFLGRWMQAESKLLQNKIEGISWQIEKLEEKIDSMKLSEFNKILTEAEKE
ncbi:MAG: hypothetical protein E4G97_07700 [Deltaproteobacteria bacterium]|nr:MAG: hypothetical protein E4G97_07700 [Deltaproteobacteria bacterium]